MQVMAPVGPGVEFAVSHSPSLPSFQRKCPENCLLHQDFWLDPQTGLGDAEVLHDFR